MISGKEKNNREELFRLMQENPDLPVFPIVDGEIAGEICEYWLGTWGVARVDEYIIALGNERGEMFIKGNSNVLEVLARYLSDDEFNALTVESCRSRYNNLPWKKAIIVYIDLPKEIGRLVCHDKF